MKQIPSVQRQHHKRRPAANATISFAEPTHLFAPVTTPFSPTLPHERQERPEHVAQFRHAFDRISIRPPVPDRDAEHAVEQPSGVQQIGRQAEPEEGEALQRVATPSQAPQAQTDLPDETTQQEEAEGQAGSQEGEALQRVVAPSQAPQNRTGLPDSLKAGVESLSGLSLDDVRVHYHSTKPAQVDALAYTQGTEIHVGPGQERHLPHEAWHVVQQMQGRVRPTLQTKGVAVNDDQGLEREADVMGERAVIGQSIGVMPSNATHLTPEGKPHHMMLSSESPVQLFLNPDTVNTNLSEALLYIKKEGKMIYKRYKKEVKDNEWGDEFLQEMDHEIKITDFIDKEGHLLNTVSEQYDTKRISDIIQYLNIMEQEVRTWIIVNRGPAHNMVSDHDIKVGTEFTFSNDKLRNIRVGQKSAKSAECFINRWTVYINSTPPKPLKVEKATNAKSEYAKTFTYRLGAGRNWWWTLDIDDGCLETQIEPSTLQDLTAKGYISNIISKHIFNGAENAGLTPDPSVRGGGGHISIDAKTSFGNSAEAFLEFCLHLQENYEMWNQYFKDEDNLNAPWLSEMDSEEIQRFKALVSDLLEQVQEGGMDIEKVVQEISRFNERLTNPVAEQLKNDKKTREKGLDVLGQPNHYNAVNIEHMLEGDDRARLELRRIPAQKDYKKLKQDINFIFELIRTTRETVGKRQQARMSRKSN